jgi:hypothetical protein
VPRIPRYTFLNSSLSPSFAITLTPGWLVVMFVRFGESLHDGSGLFPGCSKCAAAFTCRTTFQNKVALGIALRELMFTDRENRHEVGRRRFHWTPQTGRDEGAGSAKKTPAKGVRREASNAGEPPDNQT